MRRKKELSRALGMFRFTSQKGMFYTVIGVLLPFDSYPFE